MVGLTESLNVQRGDALASKLMSVLESPVGADLPAFRVKFMFTGAGAPGLVISTPPANISNAPALGYKTTADWPVRNDSQFPPRTNVPPDGLGLPLVDSQYGLSTTGLDVPPNIPLTV